MPLWHWYTVAVELAGRVEAVLVAEPTAHVGAASAVGTAGPADTAEPAPAVAGAPVHAAVGLAAPAQAAGPAELGAAVADIAEPDVVEAAGCGGDSG